MIEIQYLYYRSPSWYRECGEDIRTL